MKDFDFPLFKTKTGGTQKFILEDPVERRKYFKLKVGPEIEKIKDYLDKGNTFIAFLIGKKNAGKGTYSKLFMEAVGSDKVAHLSIGDIVRSVDRDLQDEVKKAELIKYLKEKYRGFITVEEVIERLKSRSTKNLLPTEAILSLVEREIDRLGRKAIFIDGFPRNLDQISYSLFFRALMGYRNDPDLFVFIDVPEAVIDERIKYRVVCPKCFTPRNTRVLRTKNIGYDERTKRFYLICDNPACSGARMVPKEGDDLGIEAIRERIEIDDKVMRMLLNLQGVPRIYLRNSIPIDQANEYVDDYEITPAYRYEYDEKTKEVRVIEEPWSIKDDNGVQSYSLLPAPVEVALIKQIAQALGL